MLDCPLVFHLTTIHREAGYIAGGLSAFQINYLWSLILYMKPYLSCTNELPRVSHLISLLVLYSGTSPGLPHLFQTSQQHLCTQPPMWSGRSCALKHHLLLEIRLISLLLLSSPFFLQSIALSFAVVSYVQRRRDRSQQC
jgi:hypothetical protein